jgi:hypothetical protein
MDEKNWFEALVAMGLGLAATLFWRQADRLKTLEGNMGLLGIADSRLKEELKTLIEQRATETRLDYTKQLHDMRVEIKHDIEHHAQASQDNFIKLDTKLDTLILRMVK